jgi:hypothetical protein
MIDAEAQLALLARGQAGVFTRAQATAAGFRAGQIERRVRAHAWERVLPRVYRHAATPPSGALGSWAAVLWAGPDGVLSHTSAAGVWAIRVPRLGQPEVSVPKLRAPRVMGVVVHRVARIENCDIAHVGGLAVTAPARTVVDLAGVLSARELEVALASACAQGAVTVRAVVDRLDEVGSFGRPGSARLRALLVAVGRGRVGSSARMAG